MALPPENDPPTSGSKRKGHKRKGKKSSTKAGGDKNGGNGRGFSELDGFSELELGNILETLQMQHANQRRYTNAQSQNMRSQQQPLNANANVQPYLPMQQSFHSNPQTSNMNHPNEYYQTTAINTNIQQQPIYWNNALYANSQVTQQYPMNRNANNSNYNHYYHSNTQAHYPPTNAMIYGQKSHYESMVTKKREIPDWLSQQLRNKKYANIEIPLNNAKVLISGFMKGMADDVINLCCLFYYIDLNSHFTFVCHIHRNIMECELIFSDKSVECKYKKETKFDSKPYQTHKPVTYSIMRADGSNGRDYNVLLQCNDSQYGSRSNRNGSYCTIIYWNDINKCSLNPKFEWGGHELDSFVISKKYGLVATNYGNTDEWIRGLDTERETRHKLKVYSCAIKGHTHDMQWKLIGETPYHEWDDKYDRQTRSCIINEDLLYSHWFDKNLCHTSVIFNMKLQEFYTFPYRVSFGNLDCQSVLYNNQMKSVFVSGYDDHYKKTMVEYHDLIRNKWITLPRNNHAHSNKQKMWIDNNANGSLLNIVSFGSRLLKKRNNVVMQNGQIIREFIDLRQQAKWQIRKLSCMKLAMHHHDPLNTNMDAYWALANGINQITGN